MGEFQYHNHGLCFGLYVAGLPADTLSLSCWYEPYLSQQRFRDPSLYYWLSRNFVVSEANLAAGRLWVSDRFCVLKQDVGYINILFHRLISFWLRPTHLMNGFQTYIGHLMLFAFRILAYFHEHAWFILCCSSFCCVRLFPELSSTRGGPHIQISLNSFSPDSTKQTNKT